MDKQTDTENHNSQTTFRKRGCRRQRGSLIVLVLVALVVVMTIAAALMTSSSATFTQSRHLRRVSALRALADAGAQYGYWQYAFQSQTLPYTATNHTLGPGTFSVTVTNNDPPIAGTIKAVSTATIRGESYAVTRIFDVTALSVPAAPTPLEGFGGKKLVKLNWPLVTGATSYNLYRGTKKTTLLLIKSGLTVTNYDDVGLKAGTTYYYEVTSVDHTGESAPSNLVSAKATNALLNVTLTGSLAAINLTQEGDTDWAEWGFDPMDHKSTGGGKISNFAVLGGSGPSAYTSAATYSWSDGSPSVSASTKGTYYLGTTSAKWKITLPASTTVQVARVYVSADNCSTTFSVTVSDGSSKTYNGAGMNTSTHQDGIFNIVYSTNSNNQTLTITYAVKKARPAAASPKISIQAASMF